MFGLHAHCLLRLAMVTILGAMPAVSQSLAAQRKIVVEHDFGRIPMQESWEGQFLIRNDSEVPLVVREVSSSCGCLAAVVDSKPVYPGEDLPLSLKLALTGRFGLVRDAVELTLIEHNKGMDTARTVTISLRGELVHEVLWEQPRIVASALRKGERRILSVSGQIREQGSRLVVQEDSGNLQPRIEASGSTIHVTLLLSEPDLPRGATHGVIPVRFGVVGKPWVSTVLNVQWARKSPFVVTPGYLRPEPSPGGSMRLPDLSIRRVDGRVFRILGVDSPGPWLVAKYEGQMIPRHELTFSLVGGAVKPVHSELQVRTDDPWLPVITIPVVMPTQ